MKTFLIIALGLTALVLMAEASENRQEDSAGADDFESQQDDTSGEGEVEGSKLILKSQRQ